MEKISLKIEDQWVPLDTLPPELQKQVQQKIAEVLEKAIRGQIQVFLAQKLKPDDL
ncbi:MAG: hypothetical protein GX295_05805 [Syntrophomonadaceae bacterium]|nr:hypothetical protein [Syntrophomonadaceae bacterium]